MPPVCYICSKNLLPNEGGLVYFSEIETENSKKPIIQTFTGHSLNSFWFCNMHYPKAQKLSFLPAHEALKLLDEKFLPQNK